MKTPITEQKLGKYQYLQYPLVKYTILRGMFFCTALSYTVEGVYRNICHVALKARKILVNSKF